MRADILCSLCGLLLLSGCRQQKENPHIIRTWLTMGTFASITLRSDNADLMPHCLTATKECFENINQKLSVYIPSSEISRINSSAGMVEIGQITLDMLQTTLHYAKLSEGAFDPTVAPLIKMWGFSGGKAPSMLPSPETIATTLKKTGYKNISLKSKQIGVKKNTKDKNKTSNTQRSISNIQPAIYSINTKGMLLDLGGIAKGFAVDRAYDLLTQNKSVHTSGMHIPRDAKCRLNHAPSSNNQEPRTKNQEPISNFLINLGGNIRCHGQATTQRPWCIGVRHPFNANDTIGSLTMQSGMSVATSGNYERFVTIRDKRYAHIIDPRTGYPVQGMAGATILSYTATEADALSTALFVAGIKKSPDILAKLQNSQAILVPDKTPIEIWITPGLKNLFTPHPQYAESLRILELKRSVGR